MHLPSKPKQTSKQKTGHHILAAKDYKDQTTTSVYIVDMTLRLKFSTLEDAIHKENWDNWCILRVSTEEFRVQIDIKYCMRRALACSHVTNTKSKISTCTQAARHSTQSCHSARHCDCAGPAGNIMLQDGTSVGADGERRHCKATQSLLTSWWGPPAQYQQFSLYNL